MRSVRDRPPILAALRTHLRFRTNRGHIPDSALGSYGRGPLPRRDGRRSPPLSPAISPLTSVPRQVSLALSRIPQSSPHVFLKVKNSGLRGPSFHPYIPHPLFSSIIHIYVVTHDFLFFCVHIIQFDDANLKCAGLIFHPRNGVGRFARSHCGHQDPSISLTTQPLRQDPRPMMWIACPQPTDLFHETVL